MRKTATPSTSPSFVLAGLACAGAAAVLWRCGRKAAPAIDQLGPSELRDVTTPAVPDAQFAMIERRLDEQQELLRSMRDEVSVGNDLHLRLTNLEEQREHEAAAQTALSSRFDDMARLIGEFADPNGSFQHAFRSCQSQLADLATNLDLATARLDRSESELTQQADKLSAKADTAQIICSLEHILNTKLSDFDQRLEAQANASIGLKSVLAETHHLLEHLLSKATGTNPSVVSAGSSASVAYRH